MLVIFSNADRMTILSKIGSVTCSYPDTPITFAQDLEGLAALLPQAKAVFCMGSTSLLLLQQQGGIPKGRKVTGLRKQVLSTGGVPLMVSYSPSIGDMDHGQFVDMLTDVGAVLRLATTGTNEPKYGDYCYLPDLKQIVSEVAKLVSVGNRVDLAFDTETMGLDRFHPNGYIVGLQFSWKAGTGYMVAFSSKEQSKAFMQDPVHKADLYYLLNCQEISLRAANGKYDIEWVYEQSGINCTNFNLDTYLLGSILDENRCVDASTKLLTSDLRWVTADSVQEGDTLLGFDEQTADVGKARTFQIATVSEVSTRKSCKLEVTMSSGTVLRISRNHQMLVREDASRFQTWRKAEMLKVGDEITRLTPAPDPLKISEFDRGRMSGFLDGEGSCHHTNRDKPQYRSWAVTWGQKPGVVQDDMKRILDELGLNYGEYDDNINVCKTVLMKKAWNSLALLVSTRPLRLIPKQRWIGSQITVCPFKDKIVCIKDLGLGEVVCITTSTKTFIAEGLASHNSNGLDVHCKIYYPSLGGYSDPFDLTADKSRMDLEYAKDPTGFLRYSAGDVDACLVIASAQKEALLQNEPLTRFYINILHPAARAFELVEKGGVHIDKEAFDTLEADLIADSHRLIRKGKSVIGGILAARHYDPDRQGGLNLTKASLIKDFMFSKDGLNLKPKMFTEKTKAPVTSLDHLEMFKDVPEAKEFVELMSEFSSTTKTLSTYIVGFGKHIRSDGRLHPTYIFYSGDKERSGEGTVCLPAGELVLTNKGYIPIENVVAGNLVITHTGEQHPVTETVFNGVQPIIQVTMSNGLVLKTTPNHPYRIRDTWVNAEDLEVGMQAWAHSDTEVWAPIHNWVDFEVSTWGRVFNKKTKRVLTQNPKGKWGHLKVCLYRNGSQTRGEDRMDFAVHKLVATAFLGAANGLEVRHLNGIAWDNTLTNLAYGTSKEDHLDAVKHGTLTKRVGDEAKLTPSIVSIIRSSKPVADGGPTQKELGHIFGVSHRLIGMVLSGQRWETKNHVGPLSTFKGIFVTDIKHLPPEPTYGVTVEKDHSHVTGGIMTHNTGRLSCTGPAFQCCKGSTLVYNKDGWSSIQSMVDGYEQGKPYMVLTHTGEWKPVVGVYRNGVQPLLKITTKSGAVLECTGNHPLLTDSGFVRADWLKVGDITWRFFDETSLLGYRENSGYATTSGGRGDDTGEALGKVQMPVWFGKGASCRLPNQWESKIMWVQNYCNTWALQWKIRGSKSIFDILNVAQYEKPMLQPKGGWLQGLWGSWNCGLPGVVTFIRDLFGGYGGQTYGYVLRPNGCEWGLQCNQLQMGYPLGARYEQEKQRHAGVQRGYEEQIRMGERAWYVPPSDKRQAWSRVECGSGVHHTSEAKEAGFTKDTILSIEEVPAEETFDLTIEDSHSFVANGIVVHNTIPKHTTWGKRIRKCYTAPPGFVVLESDYSAGEVRVAACMANEQAMLTAFSKGMDLHAYTGATAAGLTYEQMMELKKTDKERYGELRQKAKAMVFGLLYGMGAPGFMDYARTGYGVVMTLEEATHARNVFFETYPQLLAYHHTYKTFAKNHGYIISPLGRVRHLPLINSPRQEIRAQEERRAINSGVQGCLSDMMIWAISEQVRTGMYAEAPCFGAIHDASYVYAPEDKWEYFAHKVVEGMECLPFHKVGWEPQTRFLADCKMGPSMGSLVDVKITRTW